MNTHNFVFILFTAFLILLRCVLNSFPHLLVIVALLNLLAMGVVIFTIVDQTRKKVLKKSKESRAPKELVIREQTRLIRKIYAVATLMFIVSSASYLIFAISELGNDIIAILSLGLSLIDSYISDNIVKHIKF